LYKGCTFSQHESEKNIPLTPYLSILKRLSSPSFQRLQALVQRLMLLHQQEKQQQQNLNKQVTSLQQKLETLTAENSNLRQQLEAQQMANSLSGLPGAPEQQQAVRQKLQAMVREVDRCLVFLETEDASKSTT